MSGGKTPDPVRSGSYDQNLLGEAPRATRAQLQGGYDVDLLDSQLQRSQTVRASATPAPTYRTSAPTPAPPAPPLTPAVLESGSEEKSGKLGSGGVHVPPKKNFWRSRKGIITMVVIATVVIIVAAVVGGVVGSQKGSNQDITPLTSTISTSNTATSTASPTTSAATASANPAAGGNSVGGNSGGSGDARVVNTNTAATASASATPPSNEQSSSNALVQAVEGGS